MRIWKHEPYCGIKTRIESIRAHVYNECYIHPYAGFYGHFLQQGKGKSEFDRFESFAYERQKAKIYYVYLAVFAFNFSRERTEKEPVKGGINC